MIRSMILLLALLLTGCNLTPQRNNRTIHHFDLGPPPASSQAPCCADRLALAPLRSAANLDTQVMWYREGSRSVQPQAYAISRWSAPPAALIEQYIRVALALPDPDRREALPYRLALKLEAMEQQFADGRGSEAVLIVSATLTRATDRILIGNEVFSLRERAPEDSPQGGAQAFATLAASLAERLEAWVCERIQEASDQPRCGR